MAIETQNPGYIDSSDYVADPNNVETPDNLHHQHHRGMMSYVLTNLGGGGTAPGVAFTPTNPGDWINPDPTNVQEALDDLAAVGGGVVQSVFGRTGPVVAVAGDYDSDEVDNASGVTGLTVSDALDQLASDIPAVPVASVFGRVGAVVANPSDYDASEIDNDSGVTGVFVSDALDQLDADIAAIPAAPVDSVFGRTGEVIAQASDYDASEVDNDSGVAGATVADALDNLDAASTLIKAWAYIKDVSGTPTIQASSNVSTITDNGIGDYTINFITPLADADYVFLSSTEGLHVLTENEGSALRTTTQLRVQLSQSNTGSSFDKDWSFAILR